MHSNRRLDNKLNVLEGLQRNLFFIVINIIMVGGQVLIIFVGGQAFKIHRLDGKEWGLSIGLGAISLPVGALIRKTPDHWIAACLPWFLRKRWAPETISHKLKEQHQEEEFKPPLRVMSTLRGKRVQQHVGFRARVRDAKIKTKEKVRDHVLERRGGDKNGAEKIEDVA